MRTHCVPPRALGGEGARETENDLEERKAGWNQTAARSRGPFDSAGCGGLEKEKEFGPRFGSSCARFVVCACDPACLHAKAEVDNVS